jgi:hypothetical protein
MKPHDSTTIFPTALPKDATGRFKILTRKAAVYDSKYTKMREIFRVQTNKRALKERK